MQVSAGEMLCPLCARVANSSLPALACSWAPQQPAAPALAAFPPQPQQPPVVAPDKWIDWTPAELEGPSSAGVLPCTCRRQHLRSDACTACRRRWRWRCCCWRCCCWSMPGAAALAAAGIAPAPAGGGGGPHDELLASSSSRWSEVCIALVTARMAALQAAAHRTQVRRGGHRRCWHALVARARLLRSEQAASHARSKRPPPPHARVLCARAGGGGGAALACAHRITTAVVPGPRDRQCAASLPVASDGYTGNAWPCRPPRRVLRQARTMASGTRCWCRLRTAPGRRRRPLGRGGQRRVAAGPGRRWRTAWPTRRWGCGRSRGRPCQQRRQQQRRQRQRQQQHQVTRPGVPVARSRPLRGRCPACWPLPWPRRPRRRSPRRLQWRRPGAMRRS
jgi:hypothetical protein